MRAVSIRADGNLFFFLFRVVFSFAGQLWSVVFVSEKEYKFSSKKQRKNLQIVHLFRPFSSSLSYGSAISLCDIIYYCCCIGGENLYKVRWS